MEQKDKREVRFGGVHPIYRIDDFYESLKKSYNLTHGNENQGLSKMLAILFIRPENELAKSVVLPNLSFFNSYSGTDIDFFCPGYKIGLEDSEIRQLEGVPKIDNMAWGYSDKIFVDFIVAFQKMTRWKYSGQSDLLLSNYTVLSDKVIINYNGVINFNLENAIACGAIDSVEKFLTKVTNFAKDEFKNDPTLKFWTSINFELGKKSLLQIVLSFIPENFRNEPQKYSMFIHEDLTPLKS